MPKPSKATEKWFDLAMKTAALSTVKGYQHGAVIVANSRPLVLGINSHCTHPRSFSPWTQHAEFSAIIKVGTDFLHDRRTTLFSARIGPGGIPRMSKPCSKCMRWIREANIRKVVWWDRNSEQIEIANVRDL